MHTLIIYLNSSVHRKRPTLVKKTETTSTFFAENNGLNLSLEKATKRTFPKLPLMSELRSKYEDCIERDQELNSSFLVNLNRARHGHSPKTTPTTTTTPMKATSSSNSLLSQLYSNINHGNSHLNSSHPSSLDFASSAKPNPTSTLSNNNSKSSHSDANAANSHSHGNTSNSTHKLRSPNTANNTRNNANNHNQNTPVVAPSNNYPHNRGGGGGKKE